MTHFKFILCIILTLALALSLCSCGPQQVRHETSEYFLETEYKEDYKILQLTDVHFANKDNRKLQYEFLDLTISEADPDFIMVSGDLFTFADKTVAKEFFAFLDSYGVPWSVTFGNHDEQCYFPVDWMTGYLNSFGGNCIFKDIQDDDIFGNANFAINLTKDGETFYQIIVMDSNRYNYGDYWGYDYIKQNQIDWYERIVDYTTQQNGKTIPSIAFFHIPLPEFDDAWNAVQSGSEDAILEYGDKQENCCPPEYNSGLFDKMQELGSTKAICVGHDHLNNFRILYKGIYLCYGLNSTDRIYYDEDLLGGHVITIHADKSLSFEQIYHKYGEVE